MVGRTRSPRILRHKTQAGAGGEGEGARDPKGRRVAGGFAIERLTNLPGCAAGPRTWHCGAPRLPIRFGTRSLLKKNKRSNRSVPRTRKGICQKIALLPPAWCRPMRRDIGAWTLTATGLVAMTGSKQFLLGLAALRPPFSLTFLTAPRQKCQKSAEPS